MSRASTATLRQIRVALATMHPSDVAEMMIKTIKEIDAENYDAVNNFYFDNGNDFHDDINDFFIGLSRLINPNNYKEVARECAVHGWNIIGHDYRNFLSHFIRNEENMQNDFMVEILAASYSILYPDCAAMSLSGMVQLLKHISNPECAEGVKRVVRIFSQETNVLKDEIAKADQTNDWSGLPSLFYYECMSSPLDFSYFLSKPAKSEHNN